MAMFNINGTTIKPLEETRAESSGTSTGTNVNFPPGAPTVVFSSPNMAPLIPSPASVSTSAAAIEDQENQYQIKKNIGLEACPNLYFSSIRIFENKFSFTKSNELSDKISLQIDLLLYNARRSNGEHYFDTTKAKIVVIIFYDTQTFERLSNGGTVEDVVYNNDDFKGLVKNSVYPTNYSFGNNRGVVGKTKVTISCDDISLPNNTPIWLAGFVEDKAISGEIFRGPISCESVILNKSVASSTSLFVQKNTTKIWPGPVHKHDGNYMEHSYHSDFSHNNLDTLTVSNLKIKDYREKTMKYSVTDSPTLAFQAATPAFNLLLGNNLDKNCFSKPESTIVKFADSGQFGIRCLISFDTKKMLLQDSKVLRFFYDKLLDNNNPFPTIDATEIVISNKNAGTLLITNGANGRVNNAYTFNDFSKDYASEQSVKGSGFLNYSRSSSSSLRNVNFIDNNNIYTIEFLLGPEVVKTIFSRNDNNSIDLTVKIKDIFRSFLHNYISIRMSYLKEYFEKIANDISNEPYYHKKSKTYRRGVMRSKYDNPNNGEPTFGLFLKNYLEIVDLLNTTADNSEITRNITAIASPKTITQGDLFFLQHHFRDVILPLLNKILNNIDKPGSNPFDDALGASSTRDTIYEHKYSFDISSLKDKILLNREQNSNTVNNLLYFNNKYNGDVEGIIPIETFTVDQINNLLQKERQKLTNTDFIETSNSGEYLERLTFSPEMVIKNNDYFVNLGLSNDEQKLLNFTDNLSLPFDFFKKYFGDNITVERFDEKFDFDGIDDVLGDATNFLSENLDLINDTNEDSKKRRMEILVSMAQGLQFDSLFNLTSLFKNNILTTVQDDNNDFDIGQIPIQHMFLLNDEISDTVLGGRDAFFKDKRYTRDLLFFNLKRVYYQSTNINNISQSSGFLELTTEVLANLSSPIVCKLVDYRNIFFDTDNNQYEKYSISNDYFIIEPNNWVLNSQRTEPTINNIINTAYERYILEDIEEYEFAKNYYLMQPQDERTIKNALSSLGFVEEPVPDFIAQALAEEAAESIASEMTEKEKDAQANAASLINMVSLTQPPIVSVVSTLPTPISVESVENNEISPVSFVQTLLPEPIVPSVPTFSSFPDNSEIQRLNEERELKQKIENEMREKEMKEQRALEEQQRKEEEEKRELLRKLEQSTQISPLQNITSSPSVSTTSISPVSNPFGGRSSYSGGGGGSGGRGGGSRGGGGGRY